MKLDRRCTEKLDHETVASRPSFLLSSLLGFASGLVLGLLLYCTTVFSVGFTIVVTTFVTICQGVLIIELSTVSINKFHR